MTRGTNNYEVVGETVTGIQTSAKTLDKESMRVLLPGMEASTDIKSFSVFQGSVGRVKPEHFEFSAAFFKKWV